MWAGMVRNTSKKQYSGYDQSPRTLFLDDPVYWEIMAPYRKACQLPPLPVKAKGPFDLSGQWLFNEDKSKLGEGGAGFIPYKMEVDHAGENMTIKKASIVEWGDDRIIEEQYKLDGTELKTEFWNSPRITTANWSENADTLKFKSTISFSMGGRTTEMITKEAWRLEKWGAVLVIEQYSKGFRGERNTTLIYEKQ